MEMQSVKCRYDIEQTTVVLANNDRGLSKQTMVLWSSVQYDSAYRASSLLLPSLFSPMDT